MNIFTLNLCPIKSAEDHCDKHVVKQIVEDFQMLGSAVIRHGAKTNEMPLTQKGTPLKGGYHNHPCTRWVGENRSNFEWTCFHALALAEEYTMRYNKKHSCQSGIEHLCRMIGMLPKGNRTEFAVAIAADQNCRHHPAFHSSSVVDKYRLYYICDKAPFAKWTKRQAPEWFIQNAY
jgi:hypothetical protein